jgi:hypothetical protein
MQIAEGLCDHPGWNTYLRYLFFNLEASLTDRRFTVSSRFQSGNFISERPAEIR